MSAAEVLFDLQQSSLEMELPSLPYNEDDIFKVKFLKIWKRLQKALRHKDRSLSLVNSYYLGMLLDQLSSPRERIKYKNKLSAHYATMVERTFDLFEYWPERIVATQYITVQIIRRLTRPQINEIRSEMIFFDGTQRLEEEIVIPEAAVDHLSN